MKKYHLYSTMNLCLSQVPRALGKLIFRHSNYFDVKNHTYYPELPHKSKLAMIVDQVWHIFKWGFVCDEYFIYGLDVKGSRIKDFIPEKWSLDNLVYFQNNHAYNIKVTPTHWYSYNGCLRDKWYFALLMEKMGLPTPKTFGMIKNNRLVLNDMTGEEHPLGEIVKHDINVMVKPIEDNGGKGIFHLVVNNGKIIVKNREISVDELTVMVNNGIFLLQMLIDNQHEGMKKLFDGAVNTLRITLVKNDKGESELLGVMCMMGAHGAECSNWHFGGVCAKVNADGTINKYGYSMSDKRVLKHPDSGVVFEGYKIPYYEEAVALAKRCMDSFYGLKSVGWDVAITTDGPVIIEGNDDWGLAAHQMVENQGWAERYFKYLDHK